MKITTKMIMSKNPCAIWTKEKVQSFIGTGKTLLQIAKMEINILDIIWCVSRFLSDKQNRKFAIWCAKQCKTKVPEIKTYKAAYSAAYWAAYRAAHVAADKLEMQKRQLAKLIEIIKKGG
jgi:hypothetical protein